MCNGVHRPIRPFAGIPRVDDSERAGPPDISRANKMRDRRASGPRARAGSSVPRASGATGNGSSEFEVSETAVGALPTHTPQEEGTERSRAGRVKARYANATLLDRVSGQRLNSSAPLTPDQAILLRLSIGKLSRATHVTKPTRFPDDKLPLDVWLDVMVSSTDFLVLKHRESYSDPHVAHGRFFLPGNGSAAMASGGGRYLHFVLTPPHSIGKAHCRIGYYYESVLVQSQQLTADVGSVGGFEISTDYTLTKTLTGFEHLPQKPRVSVLTNFNDHGVHQVVLRSTDPSTGTTAAGTFSVKESALGPLIGKLRAALTERAPTSKQRKRVELEADLRLLAPLGWDLFKQLPAQKLAVFAPLQRSPDKYVVQVLRPTTSGFVVPWGLVYGIPLSDASRPLLCPLVEKWQDSSPLFDSLKPECPFGPHVKNVLCPLGFWGFRYAIEQLSSTDSPVIEIKAAPNSAVVVAQTQFGVDTGELAAHVAVLRSQLKKALPDATLQEGKDLATIRTLLGKDLPIVYFYCHGERRHAADPNPWLAVGMRELLTADEFIGWITSWQLENKQVWKDVRPLVFINACHSLAIYPDTLVSYLDAFVGTARAAGVIGTEIKVHQTMASDVAERFFELFLSGSHNVDSALRTVRLEYLAAGNLFGLIYTPYCWADLHIARP